MEAAQLYGLDVHKKKALCPFHADQRPSLAFWKSQNTFKCFACGEYGNVIDLTRQLTGLGVWSTIKRLNADFNLRLNITAPAKISRAKKLQIENDNKFLQGLNTWFDGTFRVLAAYHRHLLGYQEQLPPEWLDREVPPPDLDPRLVQAFHGQEGLENDLLEDLNNSANSALVRTKIKFFEKYKGGFNSVQ